MDCCLNHIVRKVRVRCFGNGSWSFEIRNFSNIAICSWSQGFQPLGSFWGSGVNYPLNHVSDTSSVSSFLGCSIPWMWPRFNDFWPDYGRNNRRVKGMFRKQLFPWKISLFSILLNFLIKFLSHAFNSWCTQNRESTSTYLYANLLQIIVVFLNPKGTRDGRSHA